MNGIININVNGETYVLRFGLAGVMEFERRMLINTSLSPESLLVSLIYSGMLGEAVRNGVQCPDYKDVYDLVELLDREPDGGVQAQAVWDAFNTSVHGIEFREKIDKITEEAKKKATSKKPLSKKEKS